MKGGFENTPFNLFSVQFSVSRTGERGRGREPGSSAPCLQGGATLSPTVANLLLVSIPLPLHLRFLHLRALLSPHAPCFASASAASRCYIARTRTDAPHRLRTQKLRISRLNSMSCRAWLVFA